MGLDAVEIVLRTEDLFTIPTCSKGRGLPYTSLGRSPKETPRVEDATILPKAQVKRPARNAELPSLNRLSLRVPECASKRDRPRSPRFRESQPCLRLANSRQCRNVAAQRTAQVEICRTAYSAKSPQLSSNSFSFSRLCVNGYSGGAKVAKLKPNMIELAEPLRPIIYATDDVRNNPHKKFREGAYMHKRNGVYYYSYTNYLNETEPQGFCAMGQSHYGPFEWKGALADKPEGAQYHHSVIEFKGQWSDSYHVGGDQFNPPATKANAASSASTNSSTIPTERFMKSHTHAE